MPKKKKENSKTRQLKVNIDEVEYKRGIEDKAKGWYASKYENEFFAYLIWLGTNCYEKEVLNIELRAMSKKSDQGKPGSEPQSQVAGE